MSYLKHAEKSGRNFVNPVPTKLEFLSVSLKVLPRMLFGREERVPKQPLPTFRTDPSVYAAPPATGLRVTWFGHSAMLVEIDGFRVLVDPIWEQRVSPFQWTGPKRFFPPTLRLDDLPSLDAVLISHNHFDHLGEHTVRQLATLHCAAKAVWVTSLGVGELLRKFNVPARQIRELDWTESTEIPGKESGSKLKLTAWPARHFSGRGVLDRFKTLWSSFVFEGPKHRIYFGADSGMWDGFAEIAAQYNGFDLTMLEIGAYDPLWEAIHLGPDNAVRAFEAMGGAVRAGLLMPIHWGLFSLALHAWRQPIERIRVVAAERGVPLWSPEPGLPTDVEAPHIANWSTAPLAREQKSVAQGVDSSCKPVENGVQR